MSLKVVSIFFLAVKVLAEHSTRYPTPPIYNTSTTPSYPTHSHPTYPIYPLPTYPTHPHPSYPTHPHSIYPTHPPTYPKHSPPTYPAQPPPTYHAHKKPTYASHPVVTYPSPASYNNPHYPVETPKYAFDYAVVDAYSGLNFGQSETRNGYKTQGGYTVDLPDGRKKTVTYVDNGSGLKADVVIEGKIHHFPHYSHTPHYPAHPPTYH